MRTLDLSLLSNKKELQVAELPHYSVQSENKKALQVNAMLREAFEECEEYADGYLNLVGIFYHDLIRFTTAIVLKNSEILDLGEELFSADAYEPLSKFPFVGYRDILEGHIQVFTKDFSTPKRRLSLKAKTLNFLGKSFSKKRVCFQAFSEDLSYLSRRMIREGIFPYLSPPTKISIPNISFQLEILSRFFEKLIKKFSLHFTKENLIEIFENHIKGFLSEEKLSLPFDILVSGTLTHLENRLLAVNARQAGIPVIVVDHGEESATLDEPIFGYGDLSYATHFLSYGIFCDANFKRASQIDPLYGFPKIETSSSNICQKIFSPIKSVRRLSDLYNPTFMYVPTLFTGSFRYGPFQALPDSVYFNWQKKIQEMYPEAIYKQHPKLLKADPGFKNKKTTPFETCYQDGDVYIFDYPGTAFTIAAATERPIIFFDFGIRNIFPEVKALLKQRCLYVEATLDQTPKALLKAVQDQAGKDVENSFTGKFSLSSQEGKREKRLFSLIKKILN